MLIALPPTPPAPSKTKLAGTAKQRTSSASRCCYSTYHVPMRLSFLEALRHKFSGFHHCRFCGARWKRQQPALISSCTTEVTSQVSTSYNLLSARHHMRAECLLPNTHCRVYGLLPVAPVIKDPGRNAGCYTRVTTQKFPPLF